MDRFKLVTRYMEEVVTEEELREVLKKKHPTAYIGYAPTGTLHIGHFATIRKLADFLEAGLKVKFLIADLHAHLDDEKTPFELLDARSEYYEEGVRGMMDAAGVDQSKLEFVRGSEFQLERNYVLDVLRMAADTTLSRCQRAASEVVRFGDAPKLGGFIYPLMQSEDVVALKADIAYGGIDQRGIYMLSRELLPNLGYKKPVCIFAPLLPGLTGGKMSASEPGSKIDILDPPQEIFRKVEKAYCPAGVKEENGVLAYLEHLLFPLIEARGRCFVVKRDEKYGGDIEYKSYEEVERDFMSGALHPQDLKRAVAEEIVRILEPIRKRFEGKEDLLKRAYPHLKRT